MLRFLSALALSLALALPATAGPPNVVLIVGDDQAWTDYGFMGHEHVKTPHLDKLARGSCNPTNCLLSWNATSMLQRRQQPDTTNSADAPTLVANSTSSRH